jgi:hypothetical protein
MLDKAAQEALVSLMEAKHTLEKEVLTAMRTPEITNSQLGTLRKKYLTFLTEFEELEAEIGSHQRGTPEEWIGMWKGQKDD